MKNAQEIRNANGDMPAMPIEHEHAMQLDTRGLTKREHFAAMAMQAYITRISGCDVGRAAFDSVTAADALLAALEQPQTSAGGES